MALSYWPAQKISTVIFKDHCTLRLGVRPLARCNEPGSLAPHLDKQLRCLLRYRIDTVPPLPELDACRRSSPPRQSRDSAMVPGSAPALGCTSTRPRGLS